MAKKINKTTASAKTTVAKKSAKVIAKPKATTKATTQKINQKPPVKKLVEQPTPKKVNAAKAIPEIKSKNESEFTKEKNDSPLFSFTSVEAFNTFWNEVSGIIKKSLTVEENQKLLQNAITEKILEIQKSGFNIPDGRLLSKDWESDPYFSQVRTWYGYNASLWQKFAEALPLPDKESRRKVDFLTRQLIDLFSPANFSLLNPEFINRAITTKGESVQQGINNLVADMQKGRITHVNEDNFSIGDNLATTEGKIIYRCPLFELIEYKPLTDSVSKNPILFVPPCINKYYIMDLSPNNSLVRYVVEQGQHLYLISWRNIDAQTVDTAWEDYIAAVISAIDYVRKDNKNDVINILGFCVGGTILATTLAVMAAKKMKLPNSMTLLTTMLNFAEPGDLGVFLNETLIKEMEKRLDFGGAVVPGSSLAQVFAFLRPRDLIWNYVSTKYLKGEKPRDFDILYWNSDSTNQSLKMMAWYLRHCYLENNLAKKKAKVLGETVDLSKINIPLYSYASRDDHIVPWASAYQSAKEIGGNSAKTRFVLGASGHIAGVINHPAGNKRNYWLSGKDSTPKQDNSEEWFDNAQSVAGSWWPDWVKWLDGFSGGKITAKQTGYENKKALAPAPGNYVRAKAQTDDNPLALFMLWEKFAGLGKKES